MAMIMMLFRSWSLFHGKFNSNSSRRVKLLLQLLLLSHLSFIYIISDATTISLSRDLSSNNTNHASSSSSSSSSSLSFSSTHTTNDIRYEILHNMTIEYRNRFQSPNTTSNIISSDSILQPPGEPIVRNFFRNIYNRLLTPTLRCQIGLKSTCICQEDNLRRAIIRSGTSFDNPTSIVICLGTITLTNNKPINITNKSFFIGCIGNTGTAISKLRPKRTCDISGNRQQRIFYGNPIQLFLQNIRLISGNAIVRNYNNDDDDNNNNNNTNTNKTNIRIYGNNNRDDNNDNNSNNETDPMVGGAIYLTGGKTYLDNVIFFRNFAIAGGAIYVGPGAQLTIASGTFLRNNATGTSSIDSINNTATNTNPNIPFLSGGGAIYVDGGIVIAAASGTYSENVAMGHGGAIMAQEASIRFEDIEFNDNISHERGGAIAVNRSIVQIAGTIFDINDGLVGNGDALYIADDLDDQIDGTYVFCDPSVPVSFCYGFDDGTAIYEVPGGLHSNTNCQEVGLSDIFSEQCPNYIP